MINLVQDVDAQIIIHGHLLLPPTPLFAAELQNASVSKVFRFTMIFRFDSLMLHYPIKTNKNQYWSVFIFINGCFHSYTHPNVDTNAKGHYLRFY